jgi:hypothetical protein
VEALLGKDELFVIEKFQSIVINEEEVKEQEEIIGNLQSEVFDSKGEIRYYKGKFEQQYDMIEDRLNSGLKKMKQEI